MFKEWPRLTLYHHWQTQRVSPFFGRTASGQELDALCEFLSGTDDQEDQFLLQTFFLF